MSDYTNKLNCLFAGKYITPTWKVHSVENPYKQWRMWSNIHDSCEQLLFDMRYYKPMPFAGLYLTVDSFACKFNDIEPFLKASDQTLKSLDIKDVFVVGDTTAYGFIKINVRDIGNITLDNI